MIRLTRKLGLAAALLLLTPLSAHALGISSISVTSSGASTTELQPGDIVTFDVVLENSGGELVFGLGLDAKGYDLDANGEVDDGLAFSSGSVTSQLFSDVFAPGVGAFDGLANLQNGPEERGFFDPITFVREEKRVSLFTGVSSTGTNGTGLNDEGIQGGLGAGIAGGDVHFRVSFLAQPVGNVPTAFTLEFGTNIEFGTEALGAGGVNLPFNSAQYALTVIPEPGTALLMGLGLVGLASKRRR